MSTRSALRRLVSPTTCLVAGASIALILVVRSSPDDPETAAARAASADPNRPFIRDIAYSPDGRLTVAVADGTIHLRDPGESFRRIEGDLCENNWPIRMVVSPDGKSRAIARVDGAIVLVDERGGSSLLRPGGPDRVWFRALAFSPDGSTLAGGSIQGHLAAWDVATGREIAAAEIPGVMVQGVAVESDGATLVAIGADAGWRRWAFRPARPPEPIGQDSGQPLTLLKSPSGRLAVVEVGGLLIRDRPDGPTRRWRSSRWPVTTAAFLGDGRSVAVLSNYAQIEVVDVEADPPVGRSKLATSLLGSSALGLSPDGRTLAVGLANATVSLFNVDRSDVLTGPVGPPITLDVRPPRLD